MGMLGHNQLIKVGGNETQFRRYEFEKASLTCVRLRDVEMDFFVDQPYILVSSLRWMRIMFCKPHIFNLAYLSGNNFQ